MKKVPQMPTKGMPYLDYEQLFDGHAWKLEKEDFAGRDETRRWSARRSATLPTGTASESVSWRRTTRSTSKQIAPLPPGRSGRGLREAAGAGLDPAP